MVDRNEKAVAKPAKPLTDDDYQRIRESILKITNAGRKIAASGLNKKAVKVLLSHATGLGQREVELVLWGIENLARLYTNKP